MATNGGPQGPNESDSAYMTRMANYLAEQEREKKRTRRGDPRAKGGDVWSDDKYLDAMGSGSKPPKPTDDLDALLGAWRNDIDSEPLADLTKEMSESAAADLAAYRNTSSKGKRKRLAKKNKKQWKDAAKKNKNGCAVMAVMMLSAGGGILYGMYEAGSAIIGALGH